MQAKAAEYRKMAQEFAARWVKEADDGDHFRLAFDRPGTWSQKYNLVWDRILGLNLFPAEVLRKELDYYRTGSRTATACRSTTAQTYTKLDWVLWTATLTQEREDFEALVDPVYPVPERDAGPVADDRLVLDAGRPQTRLHRSTRRRAACSCRCCTTRTTWAKYAGRDKTKAADWAPMPTPPRTATLVPTSEDAARPGVTRPSNPRDNWAAADFDDSAWKQGPGRVRRPSDARRGRADRVEHRRHLAAPRRSNCPIRCRTALAVRMHHDEDVQVYLNGQRLLARAASRPSYEAEEID